VASIGGLVSFSRYNLSGSRKVFMGDTGSMVIGLLLSYQIISLLSSQHINDINYQISNMPVRVLCLLSYPLFDTLRVFIIRIKNKKSPFSADRNHIHHKLIDASLSHLQASLVIIFTTLILIFCSELIKNIEINQQLFVILLMGITFYSIPNYINKKKT
jgi:UDP-N-acetylmuramyl pentapeptide phosphotransferase/UDP-N-acetylglucosamine-1-phosphate transferase